MAIGAHLPGGLIDRYILRQTLGSMFGVIGVVMSLMVLEHLPRLFELVRHSGRKAFVVGQSVLGLLPEYLGLGLIFGLFLAIALTVRRLSLRGELEAIGAAGIGPWRWMRVPIGLTLVVAALALVNNGWLIPGGYTRLDMVGQRMAVGDFGFNFEAGEFVTLGERSWLRFEAIDGGTGALRSLFLRTPDRTFAAREGRLSLGPRQGVVVDMTDGQVIEDSGRVLSFERIHFDSDAETQAADAEIVPRSQRLRHLPLPALLALGDTLARSQALGRVLWALLALAVPAIAYVLGKPPKRGSGAVGVLLGLVILVVFIKTIGLVSDGAANPVRMTAIVLAGWAAVCAALLAGETWLGVGFVDRWAVKLVETRKRKAKATPAPSAAYGPPSPALEPG